MNSLDVFTFKKSIMDFVNGNALPTEVKRMALREVYEETEKNALEEVLSEAKEKENEGGKG